MEKLSIEEKAKAYDELLVKASRIYNKENDVLIIHTIEGLFPELKENEDERIRKALIEMVHDTTGNELWVDYGIHKEEALAWLEKQGEQKPVFGMKTPEESLGIDSETYNKIVDECIYGEQKPADKIEPKFKVEKDKWYVCTSQYCNCIEGRNYKASLDGRIIDDYGTEYDMHDDTYRWFRPWTIQDAKDGDVLASDDGVCIFNGDLEEGKYPFAFCGITKRGFDSYDVRLPFSHDNNIHPATKKQRDLLFQKMKEAGYEWDAEKKELKKIEQKPKKCIYSKDNYTDEDRLVLCDGCNEICKLKQKPAWSEEDDNCLSTIIAEFSKCAGKSVSKDEWMRCNDFLNSLKERYTWKPSDEQMTALKGVQEGIFRLGILESLYQDLKKLKDEK